MSQTDTTDAVDSEAIPLQPAAQASRSRRGNGKHVVHILSDEINPDLNELALGSVFKPIWYSSIIFGLIWKRRTSKWFDIHTVHSCIFVLLLWFQVARYFLAYTKEDRYGFVLFQKIIINIWSTQLAAGVTTFIYSKYRNIPSFLREWENYKIKYGGITLSSMKKHVFRRVVLILVIGLIFMLFSSVVWIIYRPPLYTKWLFPMLHKSQMENINLGLFIFFTLMLTYLVIAWLQCALTALCYCSLLKLEFNQLSAQFSEAVQIKRPQRQDYTDLLSSTPPECNDNGPTTSNASAPTMDHNECEQYRTRYVSLCKLVQKLDDILNVYLLILYAFSVPMVILLLYSAADKSTYTGDILSAIMALNALLMVAVLLVSVTTGANSLAVAARQVSNVLNSIDLTACSIEEAISVQIFLQKVNNDHTGLTIWKVININSNLLITIATLIITYVALLFKFALALGGT